MINKNIFLLKKISFEKKLLTNVYKKLKLNYVIQNLILKSSFPFYCARWF